MGGRLGYDYSYSFWTDDQIIPLYPLQLQVCFNGFVFEIRANFKLKRIVVDDGGARQNQTRMFGSERFAVPLQRDDGDGWLRSQLSFRLKDDYWMSDVELQSLARDALDFAKQRANESLSSVIPVVVGLDVWTVQQEGEPINAAIDRAIRPQRLVPIYVWPLVPKAITQFDESPYLSWTFLLWKLPRIRVEDDAGLALMDVCPVCLRRSVVGAQISAIPGCNHTCHSRCFFNWLRKRRSSCPSCGVRIPPDFEPGAEPLEQFDSDSESGISFESNL